MTHRNLLLVSGDLALGARLKAAMGGACAVMQMDLRQQDDALARRFNPHLVVIDTGADAGAHTVLERMAAVRRQFARAPMVAVGDEMSAQLILAAFRAGADDFLDREISDAGLRAALAGHLQRRAVEPGEGRAARLVNLFSSVPCEEDCDLALNTASLIAGEGDGRVLLLDLSWPATPHGAALGLDFSFTVQAAIRDMARLDQAFLDSALARAPGTGLHLLPLAEELARPSAQDLAVLLQVLGGLFDTIVVSWAGMSRQAAAGAAGRVWVCCNQRFSSIRNAGAFFAGARDGGEAPLLVIHPFDPALSPRPEEIARAVGAERHLALRADWPALAQAHNRGRPLALAGPSAYGAALRTHLAMEGFLPRPENPAHRLLNWLRAGVR